MNEELKWKVVYVTSRQEKKSALRLSQLGIEAFLPLSKKLQQWSDRKKWVEFPLFNGYLFVRPTLLQRDKVLEVNGILSYLRYNGGDAVVQDDEMEVIKNVLSSGYGLQTIHTPDHFSEGDEVEVIEGPLKGNKVMVLRQNDEEHFLVCFDTLGQSIKIELPYQVLSK